MKDIQSLSTQKSSEENAQPIPNIMQSFPYHSVSAPNRNSLLKALTSLPLEHFEWATTPNSTSKSELRWDVVMRRLKTSREYRSMASRDRESSWAEVERLSSWGDAPYSHWYITKEKSHINLDLCRYTPPRMQIYVTDDWCERIFGFPHIERVHSSPPSHWIRRSGE